MKASNINFIEKLLEVKYTFVKKKKKSKVFNKFCYFKKKARGPGKKIMKDNCYIFQTQWDSFFLEEGEQ